MCMGITSSVGNTPGCGCLTQSFFEAAPKVFAIVMLSITSERELLYSNKIRHLCGRPSGKRMMAATQGSEPPEFMSTHPADQTRINQLEQLMPASRLIQYPNFSDAIQSQALCSHFLRFAGVIGHELKADRTVVHNRLDIEHGDICQNRGWLTRKNRKASSGSSVAERTSRIC